MSAGPARGAPPATPVPILHRAEGAAVAGAAVVLLVLTGFAWWWLFALFLLFDLSMLGYAVDHRVGAIVYNLGHTYVAPFVLLAGYGLAHALDATGWSVLALVAACWFFHIGVDRALGFGPRPLH
ncbi:DUF4260 family protein [Micromonospora antibiotica]|uniref:DUF4260 family protein n=1 Tax=Micromonospora antibiotica TaxID=2807623 RepID=A0ABS3V5Z5_9ACTN|nr:DUF4260 family protein [Micromonospora antibiotica]MBO4161010.1 DUF4260 family protein [Micromonospora antibiotica]